jgi:hypothetical protein
MSTFGENKICLSTSRWADVQSFAIDRESTVRKMISEFDYTAVRNEILISGVAGGPLRLSHKSYHLNPSDDSIVVIGAYNDRATCLIQNSPRFNVFDCMPLMASQIRL